LHIALLENRYIDFDSCIESSINNLSRKNVLQLCTYKRWTFARLDVLEFDDIPELTLDIQGHTILEIICSRHDSSNSSVSYRVLVVEQLSKDT
jgi:hypothetical protein